MYINEYGLYNIWNNEDPLEILNEDSTHGNPVIKGPGSNKSGILQKLKNKIKDKINQHKEKWKKFNQELDNYNDIDWDRPSVEVYRDLEKRAEEKLKNAKGRLEKLKWKGTIWGYNRRIRELEKLGFGKDSNKNFKKEYAMFPYIFENFISNILEDVLKEELNFFDETDLYN